MGKKASLSEIERARIVILHKKRFSQRKICKKYPVAKWLFIKHSLDFKILDFTTTRKEVEGQEKQPLVMTTDSANSCSLSNQFLQENTLDTAS